MAHGVDPLLAPDFTEAQWARLTAYAEPFEAEVGETLISAGDRDYPMILLETGKIDVIRPAVRWAEEDVLGTMKDHTIVGELGLLNEQASFLTARVNEVGIMYRLNRPALRRIMNEDDELCDIILHALWGRREVLRKGSAAWALKLVGEESSSSFLALRRYAERLDLVHTARAIEPEHMEMLADQGATREDLPIAFIHGEPILRATPGIVAEQLGLSYRGEADEVVDLVVVGGGPAGLAAAIYGASEGLSTVLLDAVAPGGQAASTSRIENFLGFPYGVSGGDLIGQASLQALKFGVRVYAPCEAIAIDRVGPGMLDVMLADGRPVRTRSVIVTSGAAYKSLNLDRWSDFERSGIYYAATPLELKQVTKAPVVVVGGANSAGQASLFLAAGGCDVNLIIRGEDPGARMSSYLVDRLREDPRIRIHTSSHVTGLGGGTSLESVTIDSVGEIDARGLFCFIGAEPATKWLKDIDRDNAGFIRTGTDVTTQSLAHWQNVGREPLPFETSVPRIFAAGDVRRGSMKRVAAAVGEGSSAVASVHQALATV